MTHCACPGAAVLAPNWRERKLKDFGSGTLCLREMNFRGISSCSRVVRYPFLSRDNVCVCAVSGAGVVAVYSKCCAPYFVFSLLSPRLPSKRLSPLSLQEAVTRYVCTITTLFVEVARVFHSQVLFILWVV